MLTLWVQQDYEVEIRRRISPTCFWPAPEVHTTLVVLRRRADAWGGDAERRAFYVLTRAAFLHRRKPLVSGHSVCLECKLRGNPCVMVAHGTPCLGPVTQAGFLGGLGLAERASRLMAANPARAHEIETAALRLIAPNAMGTRFKVLGARSPGLAPLPGLPPQEF